MRALLFVTLLCSCTRPAEGRAEDELAVGKAEIASATVEVKDGLAAIRDLSDGLLDLWCGAPAIQLAFAVPDAGDWTIIARNSLSDSQLIIDGAPFDRTPDGPPTVATFRVALAAGNHTLRVAPPDADRIEPYRIVAMADIQTALPIVDDVFEMISAVPDARFVTAMGDITERGTIEEYELFDRQLTTLTIPFYTTLGNHELWGGADRFFGRFGRASFHFEFKGTAFTFADSGDAGIDPIVESWIDTWLVQAIDQPHIFLTHIPPIDPVGLRYGAFRSTRDARRLLARLAEGHVDLTLYGHIHTLIEFENAGIPAFVSGGGGAEPMRGDGIDRHFLILDLDGPTQTVTVVRVD
ncbi:MAG: metallophosphoesterase [Deltaproteobacteria bacterium]|nr:metallophosphoesterase [Deltaproteobacteria bacterium]